MQTDKRSSAGQSTGSADEVRNRLMAITGHTSDLDEALDEFENVKQAVAELFDENQALAILNRRMRLTLDFAAQSMDIVERDAQMFITPKARSWIEKFREQYKKLDNTILHSKLITKEKPHDDHISSQT